METHDQDNAIYSSVPLKEADSIRLLTVEIDPSNGRKVISCNLQSVRLQDSPKYFTLSYAWRSALKAAVRLVREEEYEILCNGHKMNVLGNLLQALSQLSQDPFRGQHLWIDALCINQRDYDERSRQVKLMGLIYSTAQKTIVWLGIADTHSSGASDLIDTLHSQTSEQWLQARLDIMNQEDWSRQLLLGHTQSEWASLAAFFQRAWFSRAWVVQEVLLSRQLQVLCGSSEIEWIKIVQTSRFLSTYGWAKLLGDLQLHVQDQSGCTLVDRLRYHTHESAAKLNAAQRDFRRGHLNSFLHCLIRSREYECEDPRDKVYSLYTIAHSQNFKMPDPNYSRSTTRVYIDAAVSVLIGSNDLHILAHVESKRATQLGLPSWVPDWSYMGKLGLGITGHERYCAAKKMTQTPYLSDDHRVLSLQATLISEISETGESKEDVQQSRSFPGWLEVLMSLGSTYLNGQHIFEAFWRTLVRDTDENRQCPADDDKFSLGASFRAWVIGLCSPKHPSNLLRFKSLYDALGALHIDSIPDLNSALHSLCLPDVRAASFLYDTSPTDPRAFSLAFNYAVHLRLFRTRNGYLGVGSEELRVGDTIWIVPGSRVPLILRRMAESLMENGDERYQLVGACYTHGIMKGEALNGTMLWQTVYIN